MQSKFTQKLIGVTAGLGNLLAVSSLVSVTNLIAISVFFYRGTVPKPLIPLMLYSLLMIIYFAACALYSSVTDVDVRIIELRGWIIFFTLYIIFSSIFYSVSNFTNVLDVLLWTLLVIGFAEFMLLNFAKIEIGDYLLRDNFLTNNSRMGPIRRMRGPFEEPSIYGFFLLTTFTLRTYLKPNVTGKLIAAVVVASALTMSAFTYFVGFFLLTYYFVKGFEFKKIIFYFLIMFAVFYTIRIALPDYFLTTLYNKVTFGNSISAIQRMSHYETFFNYIWYLFENQKLVNLFFGQFSQTFILRNGTINNSFMYLIIDFGIFGLMLLISLLLYLFFKSKENQGRYLVWPFAIYFGYGMLTQTIYFPESAIILSLITVTCLSKRRNCDEIL